MKLIDLLHVPEDDELFVHNAWGDLLHAAGHFPQVGLARTETERVGQKPRAHLQGTATSALHQYTPRVNV